MNRNKKKIMFTYYASQQQRVTFVIYLGNFCNFFVMEAKVSRQIRIDGQKLYQII